MSRRNPLQQSADRMASDDDDYGEDDFEALPSPSRSGAGRGGSGSGSGSGSGGSHSNRPIDRKNAEDLLAVPQRSRSPIRSPRKRQQAPVTIANAKTELVKTNLAAFMNAAVPMKKKQPKAKKFHKKRMLALAKAKKVENADEGFSKKDDALNCTFQPKRIARADEGPGEKRNGLDLAAQLHGDEARRRRALETRRGEVEYECRVDKKACPRCTKPQSYAEWKDDERNCKNCNLPFRPKLAWSQVERGFLTRLEEQEKKREDMLMKTRKKYDPKFRPMKVVKDKKTGEKKVVPAKKKHWNTVAGDFLRRMEDDAVKRVENKTKAHSETEIDPECTFRPAQLSRGPRQDMGSFEERMEADIEMRREKKERLEKTMGDTAAAMSAHMRAISKFKRNRGLHATR